MEYIFFWGHSPIDKIGKNCLSQWFPCKFTIDGIEYNCAEQFMMAEKARKFHDEETLDLIMKETDPKNIKALGRKVRNFDPKEWDDYSRTAVFNGNLAKFSQNEDLKQYILSTGDKIIVEASPYDKIWGIGMSVNDPGVEDPRNWKGTNFLGEALMEVRKVLRSES